MKQHLSFTLTTALASAIINFAIVYLLAILFLVTDLSFKKIVLLFLAQFIAIIVLPRIFVSVSFKEYVKKCRAKALRAIRPKYFWIQLTIFYVVFLVLLFQLTPLMTDHFVSSNFGRYLDGVLSTGEVQERMDDSFSEQSFLVQNFFLCFPGIIISMIMAVASYRKLLGRHILARERDIPEC